MPLLQVACAFPLTAEAGTQACQHQTCFQVGRQAIMLGGSNTRSKKELTLCRNLTVTRTLTQHCPLMPATRGMIGAAELRSMKRGALLVNFGRGELIDKQVAVTARQAAMREALNLGPTALLTGTLCC